MCIRDSSYANAVEFSTMQASRLGWSSYGDTQYVAHVLDVYKRQVFNMLVLVGAVKMSDRIIREMKIGRAPV